MNDLSEGPSLIHQKPTITTFTDPVAYLRSMIAYKKAEDPAYTVKSALSGVKRCSPALVSLIMKGRRRFTSDRVEAIAKMLGLSLREKFYLKDLVEQQEALADGKEFSGQSIAAEYKPAGIVPQPVAIEPKSKKVSSHILSDWIHVYVKDAHRLEPVQESREQLYKILGGLASRRRIDQSLNFLLREGYLRRDIKGRIVEDVPLMITDDDKIDQKVRRFHKAALRIAGEAIQSYGIDERFASALVIPLNDDSYDQLLEMIQEFNLQLRKFAEEKADSGDRMYQIVVNLSPTGGTCE